MDPQLPATDHDAIITLIAEVRNLGKGMDALKADIKEVKDNVAQRVSDLEREKVDKAEVDRLLKESENIHRDHSKRLRFLERGYWIAVGALAMIDFYIAWFVFHHPHS
jgi:hypothetical protein